VVIRRRTWCCHGSRSRSVRVVNNEEEKSARDAASDASRALVVVVVVDDCHGGGGCCCCCRCYSVRGGGPGLLSLPLSRMLLIVVDTLSCDVTTHQYQPPHTNHHTGSTTTAATPTTTTTGSTITTPATKTTITGLETRLTPRLEHFSLPHCLLRVRNENGRHDNTKYDG
jgi:hypothetical protein